MSPAKSLADIARENQQKKEAEGSNATQPKLFTNASLPKNPDGYTPPPADQDDQPPAPAPKNAAASRRAAQQRAADRRAAAQWQQRILVQENLVMNLESRVQHLRAAIRFSDPNAANDYNAAPNYNRGEARDMSLLHHMEDQLNQQKQKLETLQEGARRAGMHTSTYDP